MQSLVPDPKADYRSVLDAFNTIIRHEGLLRTMKGAPIVVMGAGPAHAFYFACYEYLKKTLSGGKQGNHIANGRSSLCSTINMLSINMHMNYSFQFSCD